MVQGMAYGSSQALPRMQAFFLSTVPHAFQALLFAIGNMLFSF